MQIQEEWFDKRKNEVAQWLSEGQDRYEVNNRLKGMFKTEYPNEAMAPIYDMVNEIVQMIRDGLNASDWARPSAGETHTTITDSFNPTINLTINVNPEPKRKTKQKRQGPVTQLNFKRVNDSSLGIEDRIILSLAHAYTYNNHVRSQKKQKIKPITARRFRADTCFRAQTVSACLQKLQARNYLDANYSPIDINDKRIDSYIHLRWDRSGRCIAYDVGAAFINSFDVEWYNFTYAAKYTGISRRTYFYWQEWAKMKVVPSCT